MPSSKPARKAAEHRRRPRRGPRPTSTAVPDERHDDSFEMFDDATAGRFKKTRSSARGIIIMLAGHVVFATLGLAIGYYILMALRPEWNVFHLRLPGL